MYQHNTISILYLVKNNRHRKCLQSNTGLIINIIQIVKTSFKNIQINRCSLFLQFYHKYALFKKLKKF